MEIFPLDGTFTPMPNGDYLWRVDDHAKTHREIARHSASDAEVYDDYVKVMFAMARFVRPILAMTPPNPDALDIQSLKDLFAMVMRFRRLSRKEKDTFVRLMTASAADFVDDWFETDVLKATLSSSGIIGTSLGVRSPGTAYVLLHHYMGEIDGEFRARASARGYRTISNAIAAAAREAGVEIRTRRLSRRLLWIKDERQALFWKAAMSFRRRSYLRASIRG